MQFPNLKSRKLCLRFVANYPPHRMKKTILSIAFFSLSSSILAQNKNIVVLGGSKANQSKNSKYKKKESSMAIKIPAFNFISGNFSICVEKEFKNIGLLVGAGPIFVVFIMIHIYQIYQMKIRLHITGQINLQFQASP